MATGTAGKLTASISSNGTRLVLTDTSGGAGTLSVAAVNGSHAAQDLGLAGNEQGSGVLTGGRLLAGLNSVLLKNLHGGSGIGTPGHVQLTDRSGATNTIDLTSAGSLSDVVAAVNNAGLGLRASINRAGDGITVQDTTGRANSNLIVADLDGSSASGLNIATNAAASSVNSGDLNLRYVGENTKLASLNGGSGVQAGKIQVTDSTGGKTTLNLSTATTIGDVINTLNGSGLHIAASINSTGDGILVQDNGGGSGQLSIANVGGGTTATDLNLAGSGNTQIDGAFRTTIALDSSATLNDVVSKINASGAPITASIVNDGSSLNPFRLQLSSRRGGQAGQLVVDAGSTNIQLSTFAQGQNALLALQSSGGTPLLFTSTSNTFTQVAPGLTIALNGSSNQAVNVSVTQSTQALSDALQTFVSDYNQASSQLNTYTSYDATTNTAGPLFNDSAMLTAEQVLFSFVGQTYGPSTSSVRSLADLGITLNNGQLSVNQSVLNQQLANNGADVATFFSTLTSGFSDAVTARLSNLTNSGDGVIAQRVLGIQSQVDDYNNQIDLLNTQLAAEKTNLQNEFANLEATIASIQNQQFFLNSVSNLFSQSTTSSNSNSSNSSSNSNSVGKNLGGISNNSSG